MTTLERYKKYWQEKAMRDEISREKLRHDAIKFTERLKEILIKEFPVKKVVLFGSILEKGCFDEDSDIDLAVEGLPKDAYFTAIARLIMESPFDIDLKPVEDVSDLLKQRIAKGKVLYEKAENS
ncbi:DNA polymerase subunit beta [hot springs metagenome]